MMRSDLWLGFSIGIKTELYNTGLSGFSQVNASLKLVDLSVITNNDVGMRADLEYPKAMSNPVSTKEEIDGQFDGISYFKGEIQT